jgi:hypothetical protein
MIGLRTILLLTLLLLLRAACGQDKGRVRFFIDPGHNFEYVLDSTERLNEKVLELTTGPHNFVFWAPSRAMVDTTILIDEGEQSFYLRLPSSISYMAHQREMDSFRKKVFLQRSLPALLTLGAGVWAGVAFGRYSKANSDLENLYDRYQTENVPNRIRALKNEEIPAAKDEFDSAKSQFTIATSVFAFGVIGTAYAFHRTKGLEAPIFQDKAKLEFDGIVYLPDNRGGMLHSGVRLTW